MVYAINNQAKILISNINDAAMSGFSVNIKKIKIPKKIAINDLKCHPFDPKFVAASSDGLVKSFFFHQQVC